MIRIKEKVAEITQLWEDLVSSSEKKGMRLGEASQQQQYNRYYYIKPKPSRARTNCP